MAVSETSQAEINELEITHSEKDGDNFLTSLDRSLSSIESLYSAKRELASKLREIVSVKRQLDDVPSGLNSSSFCRYERRFAELNVHIQGKLRQTRKYYATFNKLMEIKELMLKETSLLNSISSQV